MGHIKGTSILKNFANAPFESPPTKESNPKGVNIRKRYAIHRSGEREGFASGWLSINIPAPIPSGPTRGTDRPCFITESFSAKTWSISYTHQSPRVNIFTIHFMAPVVGLRNQKWSSPKNPPSAVNVTRVQ